MKTAIQKAIEQVGIEAVSKSISHAGMSIGFCDLHGHYGFTSAAKCPICPDANGTSATDVEHYIDIKEAMSPTAGTNPGQKANPTGISYQDVVNVKQELDKKE